MSQRAVEGLLGRLLTDGDFRRVFFDNPAATCLKQSLELTAGELEAITRLDERRLEGFARELDARIIRAAVGGNNLWTWPASADADPRTKRASLGGTPRLSRAGK
ncbi:MAG: Franean1_4349 family RiPP [Deltaproteobacteria bacterium]|nr:Franean1_4349 family RiPP [Deltaproteobacteria bacterium]